MNVTVFFFKKNTSIYIFRILFEYLNKPKPKRNRKRRDSKVWSRSGSLRCPGVFMGSPQQETSENHGFLPPKYHGLWLHVSHPISWKQASIRTLTMPKLAHFGANWDTFCFCSFALKLDCQWSIHLKPTKMKPRSCPDLECGCNRNSQSKTCAKHVKRTCYLSPAIPATVHTESVLSGINFSCSCMKHEQTLHLHPKVWSDLQDKFTP